MPVYTLLKSSTERFPFELYRDGQDLILLNVLATWFGGSNDPQDDGLTACGFSTRGHPDLLGVSLPCDGRQFPHMTTAEHQALDGSPLPRMPFGMDRHGNLVESGCFVQITYKGYKGNVVALDGVSKFPLIDLGPRAKSGHAVDCTRKLFSLMARLANGVVALDKVRIINGMRWYQEREASSTSKPKPSS